MNITRRSWLAAASGAAVWAQVAPRRYDIVIRGGEVRDPRRGFKARADVGIVDGKIAVIEEVIAPEPASGFFPA